VYTLTKYSALRNRFYQILMRQMQELF